MPHKDPQKRKEYEGTYRQRPEVKERKKAYMKTYSKAYLQRPKVKERKRIQGLESYHRRKFSKHGLTRETFNIILKAQGKQCAICRTTDWGPNGPCIDHDHKTGKVRGILCSNCNAGIGCFKDDPRIICASAKYLEKGKA